MMRTGYGGDSGIQPWATPAAGGGGAMSTGSGFTTGTTMSPSGTGDASTGGDTAADGGGGGDGAGYRKGGPVRGKGRRRPVRPLVRRKRRRMMLMRRRMMLRRRRRATGYAAGGSVNPLLMSVSLDSRSKNPQHNEEDREPLATRPGGAPQVPDEFGYDEGGEVVDDDNTTNDEPADPDIIPWEEPPVEPEQPESPEEQSVPDEPPEQEPKEEKPEQEKPEDQQQQEQEQEQEQQPQGQQQPQEQDQADGGGGGGGAPPAPQTGYQQAQAQQPDDSVPAGEQQTGYSPQEQSPSQSALKDALDYTRQALGVTGKGSSDQPAQPSERQQAADETAARIPVPVGKTGSAPEDNATDTRPPPQQASAEEPTTGGPTLPKQGASSQPSGTASGPGNKQAIQEYMAGARGMSQDQMTDLLDRTNQSNPNLGQAGSIKMAFDGLVKKGDVDGASRFLQALRPSYDSVRAMMIAAASKGQYDTAMQLAERMNNLVPDGQQVKFAPTQDGRIVATLQPEGGGPAVQHVLTPEQFARYTNSSLSLFDHTAEQGLDKNLTLLTGQPGQPGQQGQQQPQAPYQDAADQTLAGTQYAAATPAVPNTGGVASDAGPNVPRAQPQTAPPRPAAKPPATGYNATRDTEALRQQGQRILDEQLQATQQRVDRSMPTKPDQQGQQQQAPQQQAPQQQTSGQQVQTPAPIQTPRLQVPARQVQPQPKQEPPAWRQYRLEKKAYDAFPYDNQHTQRGRYLQQLQMQQQREDFEREKRGYRDTPEQKAATEQFKQENLNRRASAVAATNAARIQASRDNTWVNNVARMMSTSQNNLFREMMERYKAWDKSGPGQAGLPYKAPTPEIAANDQKLMTEAMKITMGGGGIDFTRSQTPPPGGQPQRQAPAAPPAAPPQQQAPAQDRYNQTYPGNKEAPHAPPPGITLQPGETWLQGSKGNWRIQKAPAKAPATP